MIRIRRFSEKSRSETVLFAVVVVLLAFIWGHSMMPASVSADESSGLFNLVKPVLDFIFGKDVITHAVFRKMAHMSEFCAFTFFLTFIVRGFFPLGFAFLTACVDETIQIFVPGRGPAFKDVMIDFSGALIGFALALLVLLLIKSKKTTEN